MMPMHYLFNCCLQNYSVCTKNFPRHNQMQVTVCNSIQILKFLSRGDYEFDPQLSYRQSISGSTREYNWPCSLCGLDCLPSLLASGDVRALTVCILLQVWWAVQWCCFSGSLKSCSGWCHIILLEEHASPQLPRISGLMRFGESNSDSSWNLPNWREHQENR